MFSKKGYSVIEVLLAGSILALAISGIVAAILIAQRNNQSNIAQSQAMEMAKEGIEALKSIRDRDYKLLINTSSPAGLSFSDGIWSIIYNPSNTQDQLIKPLRTRRVTIANDTNTNSKLVTVTVTYQINSEGDISTVTLSETLSNIFEYSPVGVTSESKNYRLVDDSIGDIKNSFEKP